LESQVISNLRYLISRKLPTKDFNDFKLQVASDKQEVIRQLNLEITKIDKKKLDVKKFTELLKKVIDALTERQDKKINDVIGLIDDLSNSIPDTVKQEVTAQLPSAINAIVMTDEYKKSIKWETWATWATVIPFFNPYNFEELCIWDKSKDKRTWDCTYVKWPRWERWWRWSNWSNNYNISDNSWSWYIDIWSMRIQWWVNIQNTIYPTITFAAPFKNNNYSISWTIEQVFWNRVYVVNFNNKTTTWCSAVKSYIIATWWATWAIWETFDWIAIWLKP